MHRTFIFGLLSVVLLLSATSCASRRNRGAVRGREDVVVAAPPTTAPSTASGRSWFGNTPGGSEVEEVAPPSRRWGRRSEAASSIEPRSPNRADRASRTAVTETDTADPSSRSGFFSRFRRSGSDKEDSDASASPVDALDLGDGWDDLAQYEAVAVDELLMNVPLRAAYRLRVDDPIVVHLRGIPESSNYEFVVDDSGYVNLPYIPPIRAEGSTVSELQRAIHDAYITERIYRQITVNVIMPTQSYFVRGEVRQPGRFPLSSGMTVLKAIAAAGGYTEFANPRRVEIIRAGETISNDARQMERNPELDLSVKAGDVIIVRRSIF